MSVREGRRGQTTLGRSVPFTATLKAFLGALINRCRIIIGTQKGTIISTTTQMRKKRAFSVAVEGDLIHEPKKLLS